MKKNKPLQTIYDTTPTIAKICLILEMIVGITFTFLPVLKINGTWLPIWLVPFKISLNPAAGDEFDRILYLFIATVISSGFLAIFIMLFVIIIKNIKNHLYRLKRAPHFWSVNSLVLSSKDSKSVFILCYFALLVLWGALFGAVFIDDFQVYTPLYNLEFTFLGYICLLLAASITVLTIIVYYREFYKPIQRKFLNIRVAFMSAIFLMLLIHCIILGNVIRDVDKSGVVVILPSALLAAIVYMANLNLKDKANSFSVASIVFQIIFSIVGVGASFGISYLLMNKSGIPSEITKAILDEQFQSHLTPIIIAFCFIVVAAILFIIYSNIIKKYSPQTNPEICEMYEHIMTPEYAEVFDKEEKAKDKILREQKMREQMMAEEAIPQSTQSTQGNQNKQSGQAPSSTPKNIDEEMRMLKKLYDDGIITKEEFEAKKKQILGL